jgi:hypothetical protein
LGLVDFAPSRPELTIGATANNRGSFITHRSSDLLSRDKSTVTGVLTTNATRTLVDLGSVVSADVLENALERALLKRTTTVDRLVRRFFQLARHGRPGIAAVRSLLVDRDPTLAPAESDLETLLWGAAPTDRRLRRVNAPEVIVVAVFRLTVAAEPHKLDGFGVHSQRNRFEIDRSRQNLLVLARWLPLRFTWRRLCRAPDGVVDEVRDARIMRGRMFSAHQAR